MSPFPSDSNANSSPLKQGFGDQKKQSSVFGSIGQSFSFGQAVPSTGPNAVKPFGSKPDEKQSSGFNFPQSFSFRLPNATSGSVFGQNTHFTQFGESESSPFCAKSDLKSSSEDSRTQRFSNQNEITTIRDKIMAERDQREKEYYDNLKPVKLSEAKSVVGTCQDMCPEFERYDRIITQELAIFEILKGTENDSLPMVDHSLAVKKYRRSAAGKDPEIFPEDIRPPSVLKRTMDYLIENILEKDGFEYVEIYNFIRDRGRAIRKDFKIQNHLKGPECTEVLEKLTRFLIHSDFYLSELPESQFSPNQNRHQLVDTLKNLMEIYDDNNSNGFKPYENEAEFRAYFILLMIGENVPVAQLQSWNASILNDRKVLFAMKFHRFFQNRMSYNIIKLLSDSETSYLMACILNMSLPQIRKDILKTLQTSLGFKELPISFDQIKKTFGFTKEQEIIDMCEHWRLETATIPNSMENGVVIAKKDLKSASIETVGKFKTNKSEIIKNKASNLNHISIVLGSDLKPTQQKASPANLSSKSGFSFGTQAQPLSVFKNQATDSFKTEQKSPESAFPFQAKPSLFSQVSSFSSPSQKVAGEPPFTKPTQLKPKTRERPSEEATTKLAKDIELNVTTLIGRQVIEKRLQHWSSILIESDRLTKSIVNSCIEKVLKDQAKKSLQKYHDIISKSHELSMHIQKTVVSQVISESIAQKISIIYSKKRLMRLGWIRWRRFYLSKKQEKEQIEAERQDLIKTIKNFPLVLFPSPSKSIPKIDKAHEPIQKFDLHKKSSLDVENTFSKLLKHKTGGHQYLKLIVFDGTMTRSPFYFWLLKRLRLAEVPHDLRHMNINCMFYTNERISEFLDEERTSKIFKQSSDSWNPVVLPAKLRTLSFFEMTHESDEPGKDNHASVIIQDLSFTHILSLDSCVYRQKNSASSLSGTNAVLFHANLDDSLDEQRNLLSVLLSCLPRYSVVPLVILYWCEDPQFAGKEEFILKSKLGLDSFLSIGWISTVHYQKIGLNVSRTRIEDAQVVVDYSLNWVSKNLRALPAIQKGLFGMYVDKFGRNIILKLAERFDLRYAKHYQSIPMVKLEVFGFLIELARNLLSSFISIINSDTIQKMPFPAMEITEYPPAIKSKDSYSFTIDWNDSDRIFEIRKAIEILILPSLDLKHARRAFQKSKQISHFSKTHLAQYSEKVFTLLSRGKFSSSLRAEFKAILNSPYYGGTVVPLIAFILNYCFTLLADSLNSSNIYFSSSDYIHAKSNFEASSWVMFERTVSRIDKEYIDSFVRTRGKRKSVEYSPENILKIPKLDGEESLSMEKKYSQIKKDIEDVKKLDEILQEVIKSKLKH